MVGPFGAQRRWRCASGYAVAGPSGARGGVPTHLAETSARRREAHRGGLSSMKVFVTGGTGYIGSAVAQRLKKAGHDVSALVRSKDKAAALQAAGVKLVTGDMENAAGYAGAAYGAQAFVHVAQDHGPRMVELD